MRRPLTLAAALFVLISTFTLTRPGYAEPYVETLVTPLALGDTEFDWGRDGIACASCNFGNGNSRLNWTQRTGNTNGSGLQQANILIAHIDPATGAMPNTNANDEFVDSAAFFWNSFGNGPEWTFSTQNGAIVSQLVYSGLERNDPSYGTAGAAFATQTGPGPSNGWVGTFFPGAISNQCSGPVGSCNSNLPEGSQCNTDPVGLAIYKNVAATEGVFTEPLTTAPGTAPTLTTIENSNGIGERFVPCTHWLLYQGDAVNDGSVYQQVFFYDRDTAQATQLTSDPTGKHAGFMFQAPDFAGHYIMVTLADHLTIQVYEQVGTQSNGAPLFKLVNRITSPDAEEKYMNTPEPFIHCTPTCSTYVFTTLASSPTAQNGSTQPIGLAIIALSPTTPAFDILASIEATPTIQRLDPEYFISQKGPLIYYTRAQVHSSSEPFKNQGFYYIDTQLGPPSGPCVGSSAEDGLVLTPACISFLGDVQGVPAAALQRR